MSYDTALTSYSLLPKKAFPLDARSHFEDFETARLDILDRVCAAENSFESANYDKLYYVGQLITTTYNGTWQVGNKVSVNLYIYCEVLDGDNSSFKVAWNARSFDNYLNFYLEKEDATNENNEQIIRIHIYSYNGGPKIGYINNKIDEVSSRRWLPNILNIETNIVPFSGGAGSSAGQLIIDAEKPLNYDTTNHKLTLSIDGASPICVKDGSLSLSISSNSPLAVTSNNELTINIDTNSKLKIVNNKLTVDIQGTHATLNKNDTTTNIDTNNYIYQEL